MNNFVLDSDCNQQRIRDCMDDLLSLIANLIEIGTCVIALCVLLRKKIQEARFQAKYRSKYKPQSNSFSPRSKNTVWTLIRRLLPNQDSLVLLGIGKCRPRAPRLFKKNFCTRDCTKSPLVCSNILGYPQPKPLTVFMNPS